MADFELCFHPELMNCKFFFHQIWDKGNLFLTAADKLCMSAHSDEVVEEEALSPVDDGESVEVE